MAASHESSPNLSFAYDSISKKATVRGAHELPPELFEYADDIEILDASFGSLSSLPDKIADLKSLRIGFLSHNGFTAIPEVLSACPKLEMVGFKSCKIDRFDADSLPSGLRGLILTDNRISELPDSMGSLKYLQKLMLTGNQLSNLPEALRECADLQLLRVSLNQLEQSPDRLRTMPNLAWYSDTGNPFSYTSNAAVESPAIPWSELTIQHELGRSAKNNVYQATYRGRAVAVKLFGEGVTTDGAPIDDMNASLAAGEHPHIVGGIGRVLGNPEGREGFVMPLVPDGYRTLGLPPDFKTLTRDIFPQDAHVSEEYIFHVAADVASALGHLAGRGIMHGDVYAHNILSDAAGHSYLADFGAASLYQPDSDTHKTREKVDVRGYGYLLDDLLQLSHPESLPALSALRDACLNQAPDQRPDFQEIQAFLKRHMSF